VYFECENLDETVRGLIAAAIEFANEPDERTGFGVKPNSSTPVAIGSSCTLRGGRTGLVRPGVSHQSLTNSLPTSIFYPSVGCMSRSIDAIRASSKGKPFRQLYESDMLHELNQRLHAWAR
jgi:hypothetical protein